MRIKKATRYDLTWEDRHPAIYNKSLSRTIGRVKKQLGIPEKQVGDK